MYGSAGVLIPLVLNVFRISDIKYVFLISVAISGIIEYMTSYLLEKWFGILFWDYTRIKPNLHGRINLWYLILFGIVGIGWWKVYSKIFTIIEVCNDCFLLIISVILFVFFIWNIMMTGYLFYRYKKRREGILPKNQFEKWLDLKYSNKRIKRIFPALEVVNKIEIE